LDQGGENYGNRQRVNDERTGKDKYDANPNGANLKRPGKRSRRPGPTGDQSNHQRQPYADMLQRRGKKARRSARKPHHNNARNRRNYCRRADRSIPRTIQRRNQRRHGRRCRCTGTLGRWRFTMRGGHETSSMTTTPSPFWRGGYPRTKDISHSRVASQLATFNQKKYLERFSFLRSVLSALNAENAGGYTLHVRATCTYDHQSKQFRKIGQSANLVPPDRKRQGILRLIHPVQIQGQWQVAARSSQSVHRIRWVYFTTFKEKTPGRFRIIHDAKHEFSMSSRLFACFAQLAQLRSRMSNQR
jgi:hypothetical protein